VDYVIVKKEIYEGTRLVEKRYYIKRRFGGIFYRFLTQYDHETEKQLPLYYNDFSDVENHIKEDRKKRKIFRTETTLLDEVGRPLK